MVKGRSLIASCAVERDERKRTFDEASKGVDDIETKVLKPKVLKVLWDEHGGNLLTGYAVSGVQKA